MANLFSVPKAPQPQVAPPPPPPEPPPPPPPPPEPPPPPKPAPKPVPKPSPPVDAPDPGAADPADDATGLLNMRRERSRLGTIATSWRGVLLANGAQPTRKRLLGE